MDNGKFPSLRGKNRGDVEGKHGASVHLLVPP